MSFSDIILLRGGHAPNGHRFEFMVAKRDRFLALLKAMGVKPSRKEEHAILVGVPGEPGEWVALPNGELIGLLESNDVPGFLSLGAKWGVRPEALNAWKKNAAKYPHLGVLKFDSPNGAANFEKKFLGRPATSPSGASMSDTKVFLGSFLMHGRRLPYVTAADPRKVVSGINTLKARHKLEGTNPAPVKLASGKWLAVLPQRWAKVHMGPLSPQPFGKVPPRMLKSMLGDIFDDISDIIGDIDPIGFVKDIGDTLGIEPTIPQSLGEADCNIRGLAGQNVFWDTTLQLCIERDGPVQIPAKNGVCQFPFVVDPANSVDPILCIIDPNPPTGCPDGFFADGEGNCFENCADGFVFDSTKGSCVKMASLFGCPAGTIKDTSDDCWALCSPGEVFRGPNTPGNPFPEANCDCPAGTHRDAAMNCVPDGASPPPQKDPPKEINPCPSGAAQQKVSLNGEQTLECKKPGSSGGGIGLGTVLLGVAAAIGIGIAVSGSSKSKSSKSASARLEPGTSVSFPTTERREHHVVR